jgi:hypothetical protein
MIPVKTAVSFAFNYLKDVFGDNLRGLQLEEVYSLGQDWLITVSFLQEDDAPTVLLPPPFTKFSRVYKEITVEGDTGQCRSIKIKQLQ